MVRTESRCPEMGREKEASMPRTGMGGLFKERFVRGCKMRANREKVGGNSRRRIVRGKKSEVKD